LQLCCIFPTFCPTESTFYLPLPERVNIFPVCAVQGDLTRDELAQLLLCYIGTAADIIEFFDSFKVLYTVETK
jgi:hypothetical protein